MTVTSKGAGFNGGDPRCLIECTKDLAISGYIMFFDGWLSREYWASECVLVPVGFLTAFYEACTQCIFHTFTTIT
ncbi:hypothetical protein L1987_86927 [Smallanthus sonchifolius]|uniref:Uncharacterized protein n=1 Tax=Smallanthus sonchifolius TaxID=185202 RepID=A0ACB8Y1F3_9ASTR|nr:hypothetical protein L1987_86927 [Smallanthus sonchifolius]